MSIIQWNIRGFSANKEQIRVLFRDSDAAVICIQETKLGEDTPNLGVNFDFYRSPPFIGLRAQGGTGFVVRKSVNHRVLNLNTILQACAIQIYLDKWVTLCSLYLEPRLEDHLYDSSGNTRLLNLSDLQDLVNQLPAPYILMGDFNAKHTLWGDNTCDRWGGIIESLIDANDVVLMNDGSPTRHDVFHNSFSAIDLSICSAAVRLDFQWSVDDDTHGSDHFPIHLKYLKNLPSSCLPRWKVAEADWVSYCRSTKVETKASDFSSPLEAYDHLENIILEKAKEYIPQTSGIPGRPVVPWWNQECAVSRKVTRSCYHRYRRYPCEVNKIAYNRARSKQKRIFKQAKRDSFREYISNLSSKTPPSMVWHKIRKLQGKFVPSPLPILKNGNTLISEPKDVADLFGQHFSSISSAEHYTPEFQRIRQATTIVPPTSNNTESYNLPFTMEEMENAIKNSSPTSPGEDEILYSMVSHLPQCSRVFLLETLNGLWSASTSSVSWKTSIVVPILKPGKDPKLPKSYRPIALTSCVCKLYERMVNYRLVWFLESKNLLSGRQFGFRKNKSTMDPLMMLSREIQNSLAVQNQTIAVFFDLDKAYDTTWRAGILQQLSAWKIGGNMFSCLKDFLSDRYLKVRVGSEFSAAYIQEEGLPQGSVLSVTLFSIAINGLMDHIPVGIQGLTFADDHAIYCSGWSASDVCHKIQGAINNAVKWAKSRGFKFSTEKTKAIRFTRSRRQEEIPTLMMDNVILPFEENVKYLGITLDKKLTFSPHITQVATEVKLRLNILKVVSNFNWGADRTTLLRLYTTLCLSKIDYGCQIYGSACKTLLEKLDVVHNMGLRLCTGAYKTSPIDSVYVDSGMPPLRFRREELGLRYITRVLTSKQNPNYKYVIQPIDRAVTKPKLPKPLEVRVQDIGRQLGLSPLKIQEIRIPSFPPWCRPPLDICNFKCNKKNSSPQIKAEFNEHNTRHTNQKSIFTDGSKSEEGVGCAVVCGNNIIKKHLPSYTSIFNAELFAIFKALEYIFNYSSVGEQYVIYTDSQSVLAAIKHMMPSNNLVQEVQEWLVLLHSRRRICVSFCWVPGHVGIEGNERADAAAKEASRLDRCDALKAPHGDFKVIIRCFMRNRWQEHWNGLTTNGKMRAIRTTVQPWRSSCHPNRRASIILTRLRIGHSYLTHRYLMTSGEERQAPRCLTCHCDLTVKHILVDCGDFNAQRILNSLDGRSIQEVLDDSTDVDRVVKFLKDVNLYYEI